jgi:acetyltransferase-like isoleucine patch superfamily enzyme
MLSNNVMISCKKGSVEIGARIGIGAQTIIHSGEDEPVSIGADVIIGPRCYVSGGGMYNTDRLDIPISQQGKKHMGGSTLEDGVWLGGNVAILGGVTMGTGSIAGTGAVVTKSIPANAVCTGVPAKVHRMRSAISMKDDEAHT